MKSIFILVSLLVSSGAMQAQSPHWTLVPNLLAMPSAVSSAMPGSYTTPYYAANCGYDINGNIMFYIKDGTVYDAAGVVAGNLTSAIGYNSKNLIIVPDPGDCTARLVIHSSGDILVGSGSCYHITFIQCTRISLTGSVLNIQQNYSASSLTGSVTQCNLYTGMAVSRVQTGGNRYLYVAGDANVFKYLISASGITLQQTFAISAGSKPTDLELSPNGDKLAWSDANTSSGIRWVTLNSLGNFVSYFQTNTTSAAYSSYGLEFINNNQVMVAAGNGSSGGIYVADLTTSLSNQVVNNAAHSASQLELALNGNIYAASASSLMGINPVSYAATFISLPVTSNSGYLISGYYSLPSQLDGENYAQTFSCTPPCPTNITITGAYAVPLTQSGTWIKSSGSTIIPGTATVKLDADPVNGYVELNTGFASNPVTGAAFAAQALDGCGAGIPQRQASGNEAAQGSIVKQKEQKPIQPGATGITVYPNPARDFIMVHHRQDVKILQLYNAMGVLILTVNTGNRTTTKINLLLKPPGIYILKADGNIVSRIVKQ
jgi:Secretion system C-terminal sorting domain